MNIGETLNAALAAHRANRLADAKSGYDAVLSLAPDNPDALYLRGMIHLVEGELDLGEALTKRAIAAKPEFPEALGNLGRIAVARGNPDAAIQIWQKALRLKPDEAEIRLELGRHLIAARRYADAVANQVVALLRTPEDAAALLVLGNALQGQGQTDAAIAIYRRGVELRPDNADHQHNLGVSLFERREVAAAIAQYQTALAIRPTDPDILNSYGVAQRATGALDAAIVSYRAALAVAPAHAQALNNLGVVYTEQRRLDEAASCYRHAIAADATAADPHYNLALTLLLDGHYQDGWAEMEWRWQTAAFRKQAQHFSVPSWTGDDADGGTVLLHDEQGLGDTIQFCRFAAAAAQRARVILQVQRPLLRLLTGLPGPAIIVARGDKLPAFSRHLPLMSLPHILGTTAETIPDAAGYLRAPADRVAYWRARVADLPGLRVGLVWAGNPRLGGTSYDHADSRRSIHLEQLRPLVMPGVALVSLQKGAGARQVRDFPITDWSREFDDMAETAALILALDLVISVDTSVAHLAGALGAQVWLLNRFDCDWRWLVAGQTSVWYQTLRQFRQPVAGNWATPIAELKEALQMGAAGNITSLKRRTQ